MISEQSSPADALAEPSVDLSLADMRAVERLQRKPRHKVTLAFPYSPAYDQEKIVLDWKAEFYPQKARFVFGKQWDDWKPSVGMTIAELWEIYNRAQKYIVVYSDDLTFLTLLKLHFS
jgi:hypothetical protein